MFLLGEKIPEDSCSRFLISERSSRLASSSSQKRSDHLHISPPQRKLIEAYTFEFTYASLEKPEAASPIRKTLGAHPWPGETTPSWQEEVETPSTREFEDFKFDQEREEAVQQMDRFYYRLRESTRALPRLPPKFSISMHLLYYDDRTPLDYYPPHFIPGTAVSSYTATNAAYPLAGDWKNVGGGSHLHASCVCRSLSRGRVPSGRSSRTRLRPSLFFISTPSGVFTQKAFRVFGSSQERPVETNAGHVQSRPERHGILS